VYSADEGGSDRERAYEGISRRWARETGIVKCKVRWNGIKVGIERGTDADGCLPKAGSSIMIDV